MKKVFAVVLSLIMVLCVLTFSGCGDEFSGNYEETTKNEIELFAEDIGTNGGEKRIDIFSGFRVNLDMDLKVKIDDDNYFETDGKVDFKFKTVDDDVKMSGIMDISGLKIRVYYTDGFMYSNVRILGMSMKTKTEMSIEDLIGESFDGYTEDFGFNLSEIDIQEILNLASEQIGAKYYIERTENQTKIKLCFTVDEEGQSVDFAVYFVYDNDYNISCLKVEASSEAFGKVVMSITEYDGAIDLPSDLNTYEAE